MKIKKHNYITLQDVEQNDSIIDYIEKFRELVKTLNLSEEEILDLESNTPVYFINTELISKLNKRVIENYSILYDRIDNNFIELNNKIDKIVIDSGAITDIQIGVIDYKKDNFNFNKFSVVGYLVPESNKIILDFSNVPDLAELEHRLETTYQRCQILESEVYNLRTELITLQSKL